MNKSGFLPPVALIAGPTASGKSALALRLAEIANGTVINADSAQVYRDLRILTARPSQQEEARVPHALYGTMDGGEACSAPRWATDARAAIDAAQGAGRLPIVVGGTGLYLRTLLDGIAPIPPIDPALRSEVRALPVAEAHAALARADPAAALRLHPGDTTRVARALEVVLATGRSLADWQGVREGGIGDRIRLVPLLLLPPRDWLRARCDARFETMLAQGAADEVAALAARALDPALPVMRAIGVREIQAWAAGAIDRAAMIERAQAATRQYAKRQQTWFANQSPSTWKRMISQLNNVQINPIATMLRENTLTR